MRAKVLNAIAELGACICELQKSQVILHEQVKKTQNNHDCELAGSALHIIDILDMINALKASLVMDDMANSTIKLIISKVEKRMIEVLKRWKVKEIILTDGVIEVGKVRVVEVRDSIDGVPSGAIIEICRKGYQCGDKIIRPCDVITIR